MAVQRRRDERPCAELVPWLCLVDEAMVLDKDGSLLVVYALGGVEWEGAGEAVRARLAAAVEQALRAGDEQLTLWWTVDRRPVSSYPDGHFGSAVGAHIDAAWRRAVLGRSQFVNRHYLGVLWAPAAEGRRGALTQWLGALADGESLRAALAAAVTRQAAFGRVTQALRRRVQSFRTRLGALEEGLEALGLQPLRTDALLAYLHERANPLAGSRAVRAPAAGYLDAYLPESALGVEAEFLRFDGERTVFVAATTVKDWPAATTPGMLEALLRVPAPITVSQVFRFVSPEAAGAYIRDVERYNRNLERRLWSYAREALTGRESELRDPGRSRLAEDAAQALGALTAGGRVFGYFNLTVLSLGDSRARCAAAASEVARALRAAGFLTLRERIHLLSAWAGTLPGQWALPVRWSFVHNANVADLCPCWTQGMGATCEPHLSRQRGRPEPATTVFPTEAGVPFHFSFHHGDLGHALIVGPSGAGKSVLANFLVAQFRKHAPCATFILDKDLGARIPTLLQAGRHVRIGHPGTGGARLNPMQAVAQEPERRWLAGFVEALLGSRGAVLGSAGARTLWAALGSVALLPPHSRTLRALVPFLDGPLAAELAPWVGEGPWAGYFDHAQDDLELADFCCVELGDLLREPRLSAPLLEVVFHRIEQSLDGRPALVYVDEAAVLLGDARLAARVEEWLRTFRKRNALVILATQSLEDLASGALPATLLDNVPNRIFLPNPGALQQEALYCGRFGLNATQLARIAGAPARGSYYVVTPAGSRMVQARFPPAVLACLRSDPRAQRAFDAQPRVPGWELEFVHALAAESA